MAKTNLKIKGTFSQVTIEPDSVLGYRGNLNAEGKPGRANATSLKSVFNGSPLPGYSPGAIKVAGDKDLDTSSPESYKKWFLENVVQGSVVDKSFGAGAPKTGRLSLDYENSPDLATVETGAGGLPATPFVPNPVSPGEGKVDPFSIESAAPEETFVKKQTPSAPFQSEKSPNVTDGDNVNPKANPANTAQDIKDRLRE